MPIANDKRTHWFIGTNKMGQQMRLCNGYVTGEFVKSNSPENKHHVTCTICNRTLADPKKLAKRTYEQVRYREVWG